MSYESLSDVESVDTVVHFLVFFKRVCRVYCLKSVHFTGCFFIDMSYESLSDVETVDTVVHFLVFFLLPTRLRSFVSSSCCDCILIVILVGMSSSSPLSSSSVNYTRLHVNKTHISYKVFHYLQLRSWSNQGQNEGNVAHLFLSWLVVPIKESQDMDIQTDYHTVPLSP